MAAYFRAGAFSSPFHLLPHSGLTELLHSGSVLFIIELQYFIIRMTKVQVIIQPKACSKFVVWAFLLVAMSVWAALPLALVSALPCSWARNWFGEYIQAKNSSARKTAERTHSSDNSTWCRLLVQLLLKADEGSRLCIKTYVEGSSDWNHMLVMI